MPFTHGLPPVISGADCRQATLERWWLTGFMLSNPVLQVVSWYPKTVG
jgi:hypothetical protein